MLGEQFIFLLVAARRHKIFLVQRRVETGGLGELAPRQLLSLRGDTVLVHLCADARACAQGQLLVFLFTAAAFVIAVESVNFAKRQLGNALAQQKTRSA